MEFASSKLSEKVRNSTVDDLTMSVLGRPLMYSHPKLRMKLKGVDSKWTEGLEIGFYFIYF